MILFMSLAGILSMLFLQTIDFFLHFLLRLFELLGQSRRHGILLRLLQILQPQIVHLILVLLQLLDHLLLQRHDLARHLLFFVLRHLPLFSYLFDGILATFEHLLGFFYLFLEFSNGFVLLLHLV